MDEMKSPQKTTAELTQEYVKERPHIKSCLRLDLINYSALARHIAKELGVSKTSSQEAILVAARRYQQRLAGEERSERQVRSLLKESELEIKNKIVVFILEERFNFERMAELHKEIERQRGVFFLLEGSSSYTLITQEKFTGEIRARMAAKIVRERTGLALINFKSSPKVEETIGVAAYLSALFAEHGVNIYEMLSCWTDNVFIVDSKDVQRALEFLQF